MQCSAEVGTNNILSKALHNVATPLNDRRKDLQISKKLAPQLRPFKKLILGGPWVGGTPKLGQNNCLLYPSHTEPCFEHVQNIRADS